MEQYSVGGITTDRARTSPNGSSGRARPGMWLGVALVLALLGLSFALGSRTQGMTGLQGLESGWQYRWSDAGDMSPLHDQQGAAPIALPAHPPMLGETLWLSTQLPHGDVPEPCVAFDAVLGAFEAYVDGEKVLEYPSGGVHAKGPPGLPWQLIPLPRGYAGKRLVLRIAADYEPAGVKGTPLLGRRSALLEWTLRRDLPRLVTGMCIALIGLLALIGVGRRGPWPLRLGFAGYALSFSVYLVNYTHLKDLVLFAPRFWFAAWLLALVLNPLAGFVFLESLFASTPGVWLTRLRKFHTWFGLALCCVFAGCWWLSLSESATANSVAVAAFSVAINALRVAILGSTLIAVSVVMRMAIAGERDARSLLFGFACVFAFAVRDMFAAFGVASLAWKSDLYLGVLGLVVSLFIVVQRRYAAIEARAAELAVELVERAREKELMLRDLHDGIGALTSNVSMLAEVGSRRADRADSALRSIKQLSGTALAELRAFVRTNADQPPTWGELIAELREYAARLAEVQGRSFEMSVALSAAAQPSAHLCVTFGRVFREAITNASKQAGGSFVRVELRVDEHELQLVVENDGDGARGPGLNAGLGLPNLRARAEDLGGELSFESADTHRLVLRLPLTHKPPTSGSWRSQLVG